jgi:hypothetical protein
MYPLKLDTCFSTEEILCCVEVLIMALYIKMPKISSDSNPDMINWISNPDKMWFCWNVGQPFPFNAVERVSEIQADGDELDILIKAIKEHSKA